MLSEVPVELLRLRFFDFLSFFFFFFFLCFASFFFCLSPEPLSAFNWPANTSLSEAASSEFCSFFSRSFFLRALTSILLPLLSSSLPLLSLSTFFKSAASSLSPARAGAPIWGQVQSPSLSDGVTAAQSKMCTMDNMSARGCDRATVSLSSTEM